MPPDTTRYRVLGRTSTRKSLDPESPDYEQWANFEEGRIYSTWPEHAPVAAWVRSGHWELVEPKAASVADLEALNRARGERHFTPPERLNIEGEG